MMSLEFIIKSIHEVQKTILDEANNDEIDYDEIDYDEMLDMTDYCKTFDCDCSKCSFWDEDRHCCDY